MSRELGRITITYAIADDGDTTTDYEITGDLPVVVVLGLLRMTEDTFLRAVDEEEDE